MDIKNKTLSHTIILSTILYAVLLTNIMPVFCIDIKDLFTNETSNKKLILKTQLAKCQIINYDQIAKRLPQKCTAYSVISKYIMSSTTFAKFAKDHFQLTGEVEFSDGGSFRIANSIGTFDYSDLEIFKMIDYKPSPKICKIKRKANFAFDDQHYIDLAYKFIIHYGLDEPNTYVSYVNRITDLGRITIGIRNIVDEYKIFRTDIIAVSIYFDDQLHSISKNWSIYKNIGEFNVISLSEAFNRIKENSNVLNFNNRYEELGDVEKVEIVQQLLPNGKLIVPHYLFYINNIKCNQNSNSAYINAIECAYDDSTIQKILNEIK